LAARTERPAARRERARRGVRGLAGAVGFLTIVPLPRSAPRADERFDLGDAVPWFPLVGGALGAFAGAIRAGLDPLLGRGPSTAIALTGLVALTGALHQDGLADVCDGLGVRGDRTRRLAIMRDPTVGAFGVLGLVLWALVLFSALEGLSADHALRALIVAGAVGRLAAVLHAVAAAPARRDGLGAGLRVTTASGVPAVGVAAAIAIVAAGPLRGVLALGVGATAAGLTAGLARRAVGGRTGDTLGTAVAVAELMVCLALLASWR